MKKRAVAALIAIGIGVGAGAVMAWDAFGPDVYPNGSPMARLQSDHRDYSRAGSLSTTNLARVPLDRVAQTFIADTRTSFPLAAGVSFYTAPTPYGDDLCRVDLLSVPRKVVRGRIENEQSAWENDVRVGTRYGIWKSPHAGETRLTGEEACSHFRDFDHLIKSEDGTAAERAVNVMDEAVERAKAGGINFGVACIDRRKGPPMQCDGITLLRSLDLKEIAQVDKVEETTSSDSTHSIDLITMRQRKSDSCGNEEVLTLQVRSTQVYGRQKAGEGDPTDIRLELGVDC